MGLLRDLERDDVSRWPSGIFRRSFVRSYAEAVGLDADDILREFLERHPDVQPFELVAAEIAASDSGPKRHQKTVLRLTLADTPRPFSGGRLLTDVGSRLKAAAWDAAATLVLALIAFLVVGSFWTSLGVLMLCYYAGGILILGNSPGVCLFAPRPHDDLPQSPTPADDDGLHDLASATFERGFTG